MIIKELNLTRRINLILPIVRTDSYGIHCKVPAAEIQPLSNTCRLSHQKRLNDNKSNNQTTTVRSLDHLTGPIPVSCFVDRSLMLTDSSSTMADAISNALIDSGYSEETLRSVPTMAKLNRRQSNQYDGKRSRFPSDDKCLYESIESFEEPVMNTTKNSMWQNVHHLQVTKIKILHKRKPLKRRYGSDDMDLRVPNTSSLGNPSSNERLQKRIEQLTKTYFPTIQQLRHAHPCTELINNRMHLHREEKRDFLPKLSHSRIVR